jgi:hypothetical protein
VSSDLEQKNKAVATWTISEFLFELEIDQARRVLFVEGSRDLAFWRELVPSLDRKDTVIYPISVLECELSDGGERGRLFFVANTILASAASRRILFFADADYDRLLGREELSNVVLTDGRDLESYGLTHACFERLCVRGVGMDRAAAEAVFDRVIEATKPIGMLRVASMRTNLKLPFQRTLDKGRFAKFLVDNRRLDISRLITTLLQNAQISLAKISEVVELFRLESDNLDQIAIDQIVHGKDFIKALAFFLKFDEEQIERLIFLSMDFPEVASRTNISRVRIWIRQVTFDYLENSP